MASNTSGVQGIFGLPLKGVDSSHKLALGLAIGTAIGLMPKDNLLVVALTVLLIVSLGNLATGAIACIVGSFLATAMEGLHHEIGNAVLQSSLVSPVLPGLFELPLFAWTRLDNTVVCGSFVLGMALFLPVYIGAWLFFQRFRPAIESIIFTNRSGNAGDRTPVQEAVQR